MSSSYGAGGDWPLFRRAARPFAAFPTLVSLVPSTVPQPHGQTWLLTSANSFFIVEPNVDPF